MRPFELDVQHNGCNHSITPTLRRKRPLFHLSPCSCSHQRHVNWSRSDCSSEEALLLLCVVVFCFFFYYLALVYEKGLREKDNAACFNSSRSYTLSRWQGRGNISCDSVTLCKNLGEAATAVTHSVVSSTAYDYDSARPSVRHSSEDGCVLGFLFFIFPPSRFKAFMNWECDTPRTRKHKILAANVWKPFALCRHDDEWCVQHYSVTSLLPRRENLKSDLLRRGIPVVVKQTAVCNVKEYKGQQQQQVKKNLFISWINIDYFMSVKRFWLFFLVIYWVSQNNVYTHREKKSLHKYFSGKFNQRLQD